MRDKLLSTYLRLVQMAQIEEAFQIERRRRAWWLFVLRRVKGLNQGGVAKALGLSVNSASTVGDWERGVSDPSLRQLHDLAILYAVPFAFLMGIDLDDVVVGGDTTARAAI